MKRERAHDEVLSAASEFELVSPDGNVFRSRPSEQASWFHVGRTGFCDFESDSIQSGTVLFRICFVDPFFIVEAMGRIFVNYLSAEIIISGRVWNLRWLNGQSIADRSQMKDASSLMKILTSAFFSELDERLREIRLHSNPGDQTGAYFDPVGVPSQTYLAALEDVLARLSDAPADSVSELVRRSSQLIYWSNYGFGILEALFDDPYLKEILINGFDQVYRESSAGLEQLDCGFGNQSRYNRFVEALLWQLGTRLDSSQPVANGVLRGRYRIHIVSGQLASGYPIVSIRCFPEISYSLKSLVGAQASYLVPLLQSLVESRKNILVCGSTSSGKTTLLEALSEFIPSDQRVVVAEDVRELRLRNAHKVYLQTRDGIGSDVSDFSLRGLVRESLRMRPDRIVIGECRGAEALDLLQAMNAGHAGSLTSIHGSCVESALLRLETLALFGSSQIARDTVEALVAGGIDIIILMGRLGNGLREVQTVAELSPTPRGSDEAYTLKYLYSSRAEGIRLSDSQLLSPGLEGTI